MLERNKWSPHILQDLCRTLIHAVNTSYQKLESSLHHKQEVANTLICMEIAFYILTSCVLVLHLYFNFSLNSFSNIIYQLTVTKRIYIFLPFTNIRYAVCVSLILAH
jgi:hypothetical protein